MISWKHQETVPLIIAHRGASALAPENTLAAFSRAIKDGAHAIELDVRRAGTGEIVVIHDSHLRRTTDSRGTIETTSFAELKNLSAGSWFHPSFADERIPTLENVFEILHRRVGVNIEIKPDRRSKNGIPIVRELLKIIHRHRAEEYVLVSSFHHELLKYLHAKRPEVAIGYLFHPLRNMGRSPVKSAERGSAKYVIVNGSSCTRRLVEKAHEHGIRVGEYTVNNATRLARSGRYGVDAIFTDDPGAILRNLSAVK